MNLFSMKQAVEGQIRIELVPDPFLAAMCPEKQNSSAKVKHPYIAIVAQPGREYEAGSGIFTTPVEIEVHAKKEMSPEEIDTIVARIAVQLAAAQQRGDYGLLFNGEQPTQFVSDTIRKRVFMVTIIGAVA